MNLPDQIVAWPNRWGRRIGIHPPEHMISSRFLSIRWILRVESWIWFCGTGSPKGLDIGEPNLVKDKIVRQSESTCSISGGRPWSLSASKAQLKSCCSFEKDRSDRLKFWFFLGDRGWFDLLGQIAMYSMYLQLQYCEPWLLNIWAVVDDLPSSVGIDCMSGGWCWY